MCWVVLLVLRKVVEAIVPTQHGQAALVQTQPQALPLLAGAGGTPLAHSILSKNDEK